VWELRDNHAGAAAALKPALMTVTRSSEFGSDQVKRLRGPCSTRLGNDD
jgi:hypothetical protein